MKTKLLTLVLLCGFAITNAQQLIASYYKANWNVVYDQLIVMTDNYTVQLLPAPGTSPLATWNIKTIIDSIGGGDSPYIQLIAGGKNIFDLDNNYELLFNVLAKNNKYRTFIIETSGKLEFYKYNTTMNLTVLSSRWYLGEFTTTGVNFYKLGGNATAAKDLTSKSLLYPNPAQNQLNIQTEQRDNTLKIYDLNGVLIDNIETTSNNPTIDISNYPTGEYILDMNNNQRLKFIKK